MLKSQLTTLFLFAAGIAPLPLHAEDLLTVYQQALEADPQLKAAGYRVEIGSAQTGQALGQMLPQVVGTANWSDNDIY